jgi:hypothetical protein
MFSDRSRRLHEDDDELLEEQYFSKSTGPKERIGGSGSKVRLKRRTHSHSPTIMNPAICIRTLSIYMSDNLVNA